MDLYISFQVGSQDVLRNFGTFQSRVRVNLLGSIQCRTDASVELHQFLVECKEHSWRLRDQNKRRTQTMPTRKGIEDIFKLGLDICICNIYIGTTVSIYHDECMHIYIDTSEYIVYSHHTSYTIYSDGVVNARLPRPFSKRPHGSGELGITGLIEVPWCSQYSLTLQGRNLLSHNLYDIPIEKDPNIFPLKMRG